jgi:hypothetical protein
MLTFCVAKIMLNPCNSVASTLARLMTFVSMKSYKCVRSETSSVNHPMPLIEPVTMSSTTSKSPVKISLPVDLLPTDLARIFTHAHPVLLLSAYYLRFPALVTNPTATLLHSLLPLALVQISYAIICLPATGASSKPAKKSKPGVKKTNEASAAKPLVRIRNLSIK